MVDELVFPEGPRWHDGQLWFSDIHAHRVMAVTPGEPARLVATLDQPSGLGFLPDGTLLAVSMRHRVVVRVDDGHASVHADLSGFPGDFANDMIVDLEGRAYVGCRMRHQVGRPPQADCLALIQPDGTTELAAEDLIGPNGSVITPDGALLLVAETHAFRITAFDRHSDGRLSGRRVFAPLAPGTHPDGICLDAEGAVWVGTGYGRQFLRVRPGGEIAARFTLPDRWAVACVLGGADRQTLFMATASTSLPGLTALIDADPSSDTEEYLAWARSQSAGSIQTVSVDVPGAGLP
jgi:sugar lactone lactonase YvrE